MNVFVQIFKKFIANVVVHSFPWHFKNKNTFIKQIITTRNQYLVSLQMHIKQRVCATELQARNLLDKQRPLPGQERDDQQRVPRFKDRAAFTMIDWSGEAEKSRWKKYFRNFVVIKKPLLHSSHLFAYESM